MKKFLLSCFVALGIGINAQISVTEGFEDGGSDFTYLPANWASSYTATGNNIGRWTGTSAVCTGNGTYTFGGQMNGVSGVSWTLTYNSPIVSNGQAIAVSYTLKRFNNSGTYSFVSSYSTDGTSWTDLRTDTDVSANANACTSVSATIPAGAVANGANFYFRIVATKVVHASGYTLQLFVDNINLVQDSVILPSCTDITFPTAGSVIYAATQRFTWNAVTGASGYKVTVGTTSGGTDVYNETVTAIQGYADVYLNPNTTYFAKVVPTNSGGDAVGCQEITFSTNSQANICNPLTSSTPSDIYPIYEVSLLGTTNPSDSTIGAVTPYEDFRNIVISVPEGTTSMPITVKGKTTGSDVWGMSVFIDWNNDGDFDEDGEAYFNTPATKIYVNGSASSDATAELTANLAVPANVAAGLKTMRVKYNSTNTSTVNMVTQLATACSAMSYGQAEDYTLNFGALSVSDVKKANISVYPNPFTHIVKLSDVKGVKSISVNDMNGRLVKTLAPAAEINLSYLKSGIYIINLNMEDGSVTSVKAIKK
ncbi:MAG: GEVED domain-containing protein [Bergeyella sp.]